jgi:hypothetical protein
MDRLKRLCQWILRRRYPAVLVGLGLLLALPTLWGGIAADDLSIRAAVLRSELVQGLRGNPWEPFTFLDGNPQHSRMLKDRGLLPWWSHPQCRAAFLRPLTALTHVLDYRLWPNFPVLMHLQSLIWFALLIWATATLYRRLMAPMLASWIAVLAALLFTLDDAHAFPVAWLANRNELLAGLFGVLTLIAHDRWRRDGWRWGAWLAPPALLAGLLAKESAVCTGAYLLAYALFLDRGPKIDRLRSLVPCALLGAVWYVVYRGLGFGMAISEVYVDPAHDPIGFARHVVRHGPILLLGQWGFPGSDISMMCSASALRVHRLWAVVFLVPVGALLAPLIARNALARFWTLGMLLSLLPACIPFPTDRLLMFVGLGAMGLMAQWLGGLKDGAAWLRDSGGFRVSARSLAFFFIVVHLMLAPPLFLISGGAPMFVGQFSRLLLATFPNDRQLEHQTAVVINAGWGVSRVLIQSRCYDRQPLPAHVLDLNSLATPAIVTRLDATTLAVRPRDGFLPPPGSMVHTDRPPPVISLVYAVQLLDRLTRDERHPLQLHEQIELTTATIEITELTKDGRPAEATFRFRVPLEDPSLRWLQVTSEGYKPFRPPAIGETVEVSMPQL